MMWMRMVLIGFFSLTALSIFSYQGIEFFHAFMDYYKQK